MLVDGVHGDQRDLPVLCCCHVGCSCCILSVACLDDRNACIRYKTAKCLTLKRTDSCLNTVSTHEIRVLSHCAEKISVVDKVHDRVGFIETNADDACIAGCLDGITGTGRGALVAAEDADNTLCDVVLSDGLGLRCIAFAVLGLHELKAFSFECLTESGFSLDCGVCCCVYIYNTDLTGCDAGLFKSFEHLFTGCLTSCLVIGREGCLCLHVCRGVNVYDLNARVLCFLQCGRDRVRAVCRYDDRLIAACDCVIYALDLLSVILCVRGHEAYCHAELFRLFLSTLV